ncbi:MAG: class I SAM-dependent methyltransferase [Clostridium sp.]
MNMIIVEQFNSIAEKYDNQRRELIPMFDVFYGTVRELAFMKENGRVLDLGSGTGLLAQFVMEKYPKAHYILVDIAEEMLKVAKERFKGYENVDYKVCDYRTEELGEYDLIISGMSIHHLDSEEKRELFKSIYKSLKKGGVFINADQVFGEDKVSEEIQKKYQFDYIENCSLSREDKDKTYERIKMDKMDTMSYQIEMLKEAGFNSVDIYYKCYNYTVFRASK